MSKSGFEIADVFRAGFSDYCNKYGPLPKEHYSVANALMSCHTAIMGGHKYRCDSCSHDLITYNSCRNRHCPSCQAAARAQWVEKRTSELLPVSYFHVVFTIPSELNPFILRNKEVSYNILFKAASETLLQLAKDPRLLGAQTGFISVLHTWGQALFDHPHLHCIVPGGGLNGDEWVAGADKEFLFPVKVVANLFRGKFMDYFKSAIRSKELQFHGELRCFEEDPAFLQQLIDCCYSADWVVYAKPPFGGPAAVVKYLGRYTHRIAIANSRILALSDTHVTFKWKDYADNNRVKEMVLTVSEFIRRFLLHVLPKRFVRIRYFGFLGMRIRKNCLQFCREQLCTIQEIAELTTDEYESVIIEAIKKVSSFKCPHCGNGRMQRHSEFLRYRPGYTKTAA
jgi:predicted RNA-binding Zn-ribbon protein involved in translation (DUF1610 family)